jgi:tetratricopeptide (TPR) repeat protein
MSTNKNTKDSLIPVDSNKVARIAGSLEITKKILYGNISELFNSAFSKLNSEEELDERMDFLHLIETNHLHANKYSYRAKEKSDYKTALEGFTSVLKIRPAHYWSTVMRGIAKAALSDYQGALEDYNKAIEIDANYALAYNARGIVKRKLEDYYGAGEDYNKALEIDPEFSSAYNNRNVLTLNVRKYNRDMYTDFKKAIGVINVDIFADYQKATSINPKNAVAYCNQGQFMITGQGYESFENLVSWHERAIHCFDCAININPNYALAYNRRGTAYYRMHKFKEAIEDYNKAIEIDPSNNYNIYYRRGQAKELEGDFKGAIEDFGKAIEFAPENYKAYKKRGCAKGNWLEDAYGGIIDLDKAIEINANYANAYLNRGYLKCTLQEYHGAIEDFGKAINISKAIEVNPGIEFDSYFHRGETKEELEDYHGALDDYYKAFDIDPDNPNLIEAIDRLIDIIKGGEGAK